MYQNQHRTTLCIFYDDVIKLKHLQRYWPVVRGIHRSPVNSPHKGQWRGALLFSLICAWTNDEVNNWDAGDLRRYHTHYDVTVISWDILYINWSTTYIKHNVALIRKSRDYVCGMWQYKVLVKNRFRIKPHCEKKICKTWIMYKTWIKAGNQQKMSLRYTKLTHELSFKTET